MSGLDDPGGIDNLGPIGWSPAEPVFDHDWERRVFAIMFICAVHGYVRNNDEARRGMADMNGRDYLATPYYEHWYHAIRMMMLEKGVASDEELDTGKSHAPKDPEVVPFGPLHLQMLATHGMLHVASEGPAARYQPGDVVKTKLFHSREFTRLPRYVRGKFGRIVKHVGYSPWPEELTRRDTGPMAVYTVEFDFAEVWGEDAEGANDKLYLELWEEYLLPATGAGAELQ